MPLLWKSWRKRKKQQQQPVTGGSSTTESATSSIELPPSLQEVEDEEEELGAEEARKKAGEREVIFAMVIQDFNKSACDELSVQRGQMIQPLYNDGTWLYVRNIDGRYGYIPANFCSPLDQMKELHWKTDGPSKATRKVRPRKQSIHDLVKPTLHSSPSAYDSLPSTPAVTHLASFQSSPRNACTANTSFTDSQVSEPLSRQEVWATERPQARQAAQNTVPPVQILHPLHPLSFSQRVEATELQKKRKSPAHHHHHTGVHDRTNSYQEAVIGTEETLEGQNVGIVPPPQVVVHRPSRPSHLPLTHNIAYDHLESYQLDTLNKTTTEGAPMSSRESQLADDVFLPAAHKPFGIYRALGDYQKQAEGEVSVRRNEYVIVMELGVGQWAGVITAAGAEGLVPKGLLHRYSPHHTSCSVATQTELMIVAPSVFNIGTGSSSGHYQSAQREVVSIQEVSLPVRQRRKRRKRHSQLQQPTIETAIQTDAQLVPSFSSSHHCLLQPQAWTSKTNQLENSFWYENSISIPQLPRHDSSSSQTLPSINGFVHKHTFPPQTFHSSHQSITHQPPAHDVPPPPLMLDSDSLESISSLEASRNVGRGVEEVDNGREPKEDEAEGKDALCPLVAASAVADIPNPNLPPKPAQMVMLTAMKEFTPCGDRPNSLPLQRGDILQLTPGDNKLQDGLIWAYHTGLEVHGFVPKSHMAYLYLTPLRRKRNPSSIDEPV